MSRFRSARLEEWGSGSREMGGGAGEGTGRGGIRGSIGGRVGWQSRLAVHFSNILELEILALHLPDGVYQFARFVSSSVVHAVSGSSMILSPMTRAHPPLDTVPVHLTAHPTSMPAKPALLPTPPPTTPP